MEQQEHKILGGKEELLALMQRSVDEHGWFTLNGVFVPPIYAKLWLAFFHGASPSEQALMLHEMSTPEGMKQQQLTLITMYGLSNPEWLARLVKTNKSDYRLPVDPPPKQETKPEHCALLVTDDGRTVEEHEWAPRPDMLDECIHCGTTRPHQGDQP